MNLKKLGLAAAVAALALAGQAQAATTISSTFDTGAEGWRFGSFEYVRGPLSYDAAAQALTSQTAVAGWGFLAPETFLGDRSEYVGGAFSFDLSLAEPATYERPLIALRGANQTIFARWGSRPTPDLQTFTVRLTAANFYSGSTTKMDADVTAADFAAVMADLDGIQIFGDWNPRTDTLKLDNVNLAGAPMGAVPEPGAWALMILGFGGAGAVLRRRRRLAPTAAA